MSIRAVARLAPAVAAALVAACSSTPTDPAADTTTMTAVEANAAADVVVADLAAEAEGATASPTSTGFFIAAVDGAAEVSAWWGRCTPAPTRTVSGSTATFVFANCTASRPGVAGEQVVRNGTVAVTAEAGLRRAAFTNFRTDRTFFLPRENRRVTTSDTHNGTRQVTRDDGSVLTRTLYGATTSDPFRSDFVAPDSSTGTHLKRWNASFTADTAGSIRRDEPLPAGTFAVSGTSAWARTRAGTTRNWSFTLATGAQGLHFNPTCVAPGPNFDRGTVTIVATGPAGGTTTLVVTFTGCGVYTVQRS